MLGVFTFVRTISDGVVLFFSIGKVLRAISGFGTLPIKKKTWSLYQGEVAEYGGDLIFSMERSSGVAWLYGILWAYTIDSNYSMHILIVGNMQTTYYLLWSK